MQRLIMVATIVAAGLVPASGCARSGSDQGGNPPAQSGEEVTKRVGVLRGGMMGIGGETTGWELNPGDGRPPLEVDVSGVREQARRLDGQRVTVTGRMTEKRYVERGIVPILVAESIEPAAGGSGPR